MDSGTALDPPTLSPWAWQFRHDRWLQQCRPVSPPVFERGRRHSAPRDIEHLEQEYFATANWSDALAWRLERIHGLRRARSGSKRERIERELEELLPQAATRINDYVETIRNIGLPSMLESIQLGVGAKRSNARSALTLGLAEHPNLRPLWEQRAVLLTHQHRMHPDISLFPRTRFYDTKALIDANTLTSRDEKVGWAFAHHQPKRRLWLDVEGRESHGVNRQEVEQVRRVLSEFRSFAQRCPRKDGTRWQVACLAFYTKQHEALVAMIRELTHQPRRNTRFVEENLEIVCGTVDRFQGREADLVILSLRNVNRMGFLDSPNRLNVAVTRGRHMLVLVGHYETFAQARADEWSELAANTQRLHSWTTS